MRACRTQDSLIDQFCIFFLELYEKVLYHTFIDSSNFH